MIFEPSSGGNGIELNTASKILIITIYSTTSRNDCVIYIEPKRIPNPKTSAIKRFDNGPAAATIAGPHFWFFRLYGLYGTGFAHPKINPVPEKARSAGIITEPKGSICGIGLSVSLPAILAVGSPNFSAAKPCDTSCITTDIIRTAMKNIIVGSIEVNLTPRHKYLPNVNFMITYDHVSTNVFLILSEYTLWQKYVKHAEKALK